MNEQEFGVCDICGKSGLLSRKYYYYDIKCDCHSPKHFELIRHCKNCVPKPPRKTVVTMQPIEEE